MKLNKRLLIIIAIVILLIIIVVVIVFASRSRREKAVSTISTTSTTTSLPGVGVSFPTSSIAQNQDATVSIGKNNASLDIKKGNTSSNLKLGFLTAPNGQLVLSPDDKLAVGLFPTVAENGSRVYLLSEGKEPLALNSDIVEVALVYNNGDMVYFDGAKGIIAYGNAYTGSERQLAQVEATDAGMAILDQTHILFWNAASQADPNNLAANASSLYKLNVLTGAKTTVIAEKSVIDVSISPSGNQVLVNRVVDNTINTWLFSLSSGKYIRQVAENIDLSSGAWNKDETKFAYWNSRVIMSLDLSTGQATSVTTVNDSTKVGNPLGFDGINIVVYSLQIKPSE